MSLGEPTGEHVSAPPGLTALVRTTVLLVGNPGRLEFLLYEGWQRYPSPGTNSTADGHPGS